MKTFVTFFFVVFAFSFSFAQSSKTATFQGKVAYVSSPQGFEIQMPEKGIIISKGTRSTVTAVVCVEGREVPWANKLSFSYEEDTKTLIVEFNTEHSFSAEQVAALKERIETRKMNIKFITVMSGS